MTTRDDSLVSHKSEQEWLEFWDEFFNGEPQEDDSNTDIKHKHRKHRRLNRVHKKLLKDRNMPIKQKREADAVRHGIEPKRFSLYRSVDNGKNHNPSKPIAKREKQRIFSPESFED